MYESGQVSVTRKRFVEQSITYTLITVEILAGLTKLGVELTPEEQHVLDQSSTRDAFTAATGAMGEATTAAFMSIAASHNDAASASTT